MNIIRRGGSVKKNLKIASWVLFGVGLIGIGLFFDYYLPHTKYIEITGTEIKRMDGKPDDANPTVKTSRDVRFIIGIDLDANESVVFRNEDTGWGWPPYFKFNSGSLDAHAVNITAQQSKDIVLVKYYGWRMGMFSMFPNAISLKVVEKGHSHLPLFNIVFLVLLFGLVGFSYFRIRRWRKRRNQHRQQETQPPKNDL